MHGYVTAVSVISDINPYMLLKHYTLFFITENKSTIAQISVSIVLTVNVSDKHSHIIVNKLKDSRPGFTE